MVNTEPTHHGEQIGEQTGEQTERVGIITGRDVRRHRVPCQAVHAPKGLPGVNRRTTKQATRKDGVVRGDTVSASTE